MQGDYKQIYKQLSVETGKPEQLYKDIGNYIFQETYNMLRKPTNLIVKLKGVGSWHLRKRRMEIVVKDYPDRTIERQREEFDSDEAYLKYRQKKEQYDTFVERLKDYEKYLSIKKEIRTLRNETQILLEPDKGEDERFKSS